MEEDIEALQERLLEEVRHACYPSVRSAIRDRYADTSYYIFKKTQNWHRGSFLSFGSRRSSMVSSYGNTPTIIRRSLSSSGMLEYSLEQVGSHTLHDSHILPSITKEEKETEDQEGPETPNLRDESIASPLQNDVLVSLTHEKDATVENDYHLKNRKIFHHYDMPLTRKQSLPQKLQEVKEDQTDGGEDEEENLMDPLLGGKEERLNIAAGEVARSRDKISAADPQTVHLQQKAEPSPILPRIATSSRPEEPDDAKQKVGSLHKGSMKEGGEAAFSLPPTHEASPLLRAGSVNEKTSETAFPRKSVNRFSLRDLPLRSPTPPKKSPRKTSKIAAAKEREGVKEATHTDPRPTTALSSDSAALPSSSSLPPLIAAGKCDSTASNGSLHSGDHSVHNLDDTPLFIVEDEDYKKPSTVSPRIGIHSLVADGKLSKSFIVVHPSNDSNSLGLAPLTAAAAASSLRKKAPPPAASEGRTAAASSASTNGTKTFLLYPNRSSGTSRLSLTRSTIDSGTSAAINRRNNASGSFLSAKRPSQVRLLRFRKSSEDGGLSPCIPTTPKASSFQTNIQTTKVQIRSFPLDTSYEKGLSQDFTGNFVNTNSSRLCTVM